VSYNILNIPNFCHNVVTTIYNFACIASYIHKYTVVFIQFTQVSNYRYFLIFSLFDLLLTSFNFTKMAAATLNNK